MSAPVTFAAPTAEVAPLRRGRGVLVVVLALLLGAGGAAWLLLGAGDSVEEEVGDGPIVTLEPQTTTLGEQGLHHARIGIAVVLAEGQEPTVVDEHKPLLQDALVAELSTSSGDELRSGAGSAALREALSAHAVRIWGEDVVRRVVLTELLVQ